MVPGLPCRGRPVLSGRDLREVRGLRRRDDQRGPALRRRRDQAGRVPRARDRRRGPGAQPGRLRRHDQPDRPVDGRPGAAAAGHLPAAGPAGARHRVAGHRAFGLLRRRSVPARRRALGDAGRHQPGPGLADRRRPLRRAPAATAAADRVGHRSEQPHARHDRPGRVQVHRGAQPRTAAAGLRLRLRLDPRQLLDLPAADHRGRAALARDVRPEAAPGPLGAAGRLAAPPAAGHSRGGRQGLPVAAPQPRGGARRAGRGRLLLRRDGDAPPRQALRGPGPMGVAQLARVAGLVGRASAALAVLGVLRVRAAGLAVVHRAGGAAGGGRRGVHGLGVPAGQGARLLVQPAVQPARGHLVLPGYGSAAQHGGRLDGAGAAAGRAVAVRPGGARSARAGQAMYRLDGTVRSWRG